MPLTEPADPADANVKAGTNVKALGDIKTGANRLMHPGTWHLRTRLVAIMMVLLAVICLLVGFISYSALNATLNNQLDNQVSAAMDRTLKTPYVDFINQLSTSSPAQPTSGKAAFHSGNPGQLVVFAGPSASPVAFAYPSAAQDTGIVTLSLTPSDVTELTKVSREHAFYDLHLSVGEYRVQAKVTSGGLTVIAGLPLASTQQTLTTLVLTMVLVSLACLIIVGLVGTLVIRRSLRPLEKLSTVASRVAELPLDAGEVALSVRVPPSAATAGTEVGNVGMAFNAMLDNVSHALQARQRSETKVRRFVADASHELRTPLTAIRGYTELLNMTERLSDSGKTSLGRVNAQSLRMSRLVEDLLTLARLDEGQPLTLRTLDLSPLVMDAVSDVRVTAPDHEWQFEVPDTPVNVKGDDGQLKQVLLNLLSNAAKHTPAGTTVRTVLKQDPDGSAVLTVQDNGPGIDPGFLSTIFDRFSRADVSRTGTQGSTGLGLSIVQAMVKAQGGTVSVTSKPGETCFTLRMPAAKAPLTGTLPVIPPETVGPPAVSQKH